jgi:threonine synthase
MEALFSHDVHKMADRVSGYAFTDGQTREAIRSVFGDTGYVMCPHTAVAWLGLQRYLRDHPGAGVAPVFLSTAHPCKFEEVYDQEVRARLVYPDQVKAFGAREKRSTRIAADYDRLKKLLEAYS